MWQDTNFYDISVLDKLGRRISDGSKKTKDEAQNV